MIEQSFEPVNAYLSSGVRHTAVRGRRCPFNNRIDSPLSEGGLNCKYNKDTGHVMYDTLLYTTGERVGLGMIICKKKVVQIALEFYFNLARI